MRWFGWRGGQEEIGELIGQPGPPDPAAIAEVRARHDIQQLTPMLAGRPR